MSKKVKGTKLDLASFVGPSDPIASLPSAPDPNRAPRDRNGPRGFENNPRGERGERQERPERGDRQGGDRFQPSRSDDADWGRERGAPSRPSNNYDSRPSNNQSFEAAERPAHMRLNLAPRSTASAAAPAQSAAADDGEDKWSKVFSKSSGASDRSSGNSRFDSRGGDARNQDSRGGYDGGRDSRGGGGGGRFSRGGRDEEVDDPRFAGKFGGGSSGGPRRTGGEVNSMSLPSAPRSVASSAPVTVFSAPVAVVDTKAIEAKEAKEKAKAEREERERKAKEEKELAALAAATKALQLKEDNAAAEAKAVEILGLGHKGEQLLAAAKASATKLNAAMLFKAVLEKTNDLVATPWWTKAEYGALLGFYLSQSIDAQIAALYVLQEFCHARSFPKVQVKGKERKLIEFIFSTLLSQELVDFEGFMGWADDASTLYEDSKGRIDAIVQTTAFITSVRNAMEANDEEGDDDEEIDAPRQTIK